MSRLDDEIDSTINEILERVGNNDSCYHLFQKLHALVQSEPSRFSKRFVEKVEEYAEFDLDVEYSLEEALTIQSLFEAQRVIDSHGQSELSSELALFHLEEEDKKEILKKCEQMRKIIWSSTAFDKPHRRRLLRRVSAIEIEVQKEQGLFDVVLGGLSDFGESMGKFGTDIKPLTDRMKDIASTVRKNTPEYDELPAPDETPQLPSPKD